MEQGAKSWLLRTNMHSFALVCGKKLAKLYRRRKRKTAVWAGTQNDGIFKYYINNTYHNFTHRSTQIGGVL